MELNYSLLFDLNKPKNYTSGPIPVCMRFTVDGIPKECATTRAADPESASGNKRNQHKEACWAFIGNLVSIILLLRLITSITLHIVDQLRPTFQRIHVKLWVLSDVAD